MIDPTYPIQVALVARLKALATGAANAVYDTVPKTAGFPRITLGPFQTVLIDETCSDGSEVSVQVDVWSRKPGLPECQQIVAQIRAGLDEQSLMIAGHRCDRMHIRDISFSRDPDGLTSRARVDLVVITQPA